MAKQQIKWFGYQVLRFIFSNNVLGKPLRKSCVSRVLGRRLIIPASGKLAIEVAGVSEFYMLSDGADSIASRIYFKGYDAFEKDSLDVFINLLSESRTVLDIGANTGIYTLVASIHNRERKVYSFEPLDFVYSYLKKNIIVNNFKNVTPLCIGLDDESHVGSSTLFIPTGITLPTGASLKKYDWPKVEETTINCKSLDSIQEELDITDIDLIKIDAETLEPRILKGGVKTLERFLPAILCEILNQSAADEIQKFLTPMGYLFYRLEKGVLKESKYLFHDPQGIFINFLMLHPKTRLPDGLRFCKTEIEV